MSRSEFLTYYHDHIAPRTIEMENNFKKQFQQLNNDINALNAKFDVIMQLLRRENEK